MSKRKLDQSDFILPPKKERYDTITNNIILDYEKKIEHIINLYENKLITMKKEHDDQIEQQREYLMSLFQTYISDKYNTSDVSYIN
jgi:hypothetical protein